MESDAEVKKGQCRCDQCGGIFDLQEDEEWNSEKAKQELERDFGSVPEKDLAVVCDDCYQKMCPANNPDFFELYKEECKKRN